MGMLNGRQAKSCHCVEHAWWASFCYEDFKSPAQSFLSQARHKHNASAPQLIRINLIDRIKFWAEENM
jgi:hypothetical protein